MTVSLPLISAVDPTTIIFIVLLGILIISLLVVPAMKNKMSGNAGAQPPASTDSSADQQVQQPRAVTNNGYYRWQPDNQNYVARNEEQARIVKEYFIIKNYTKTEKNMPMLVMGLLAAVVGAILAIVGISNSTTALIIIGAIAVVVGLILLYLYKKGGQTTTAPEKVMTDSEYDTLVNNRIAGLYVKSTALKKLGLEESDIIDEPIIITAPVRTNTSLVNYTEEQLKLRSSTISVAAIFHTANKLYIYKVQFDMCCNEKSEQVCEYCFEDICDISVCTDCTVAYAPNYIFDYTKATMNVATAGAKVYIPLDPDKNYTETSNNLMYIIREKRSTSAIPERTVRDKISKK